VEVNILPSEKILEQKKALVASLSDKLKNSCAGVIVNYKGINVSDDTKLRKELRESGVEYFVVKNTLLQRAAKEAGLDGLEPVLEGTTAIAISKEDHVAAARILCKFADENDFFKAKAGFIEGKVISEAEVNNLAKLPTKEVLVAKALGGLNAPISGFVTVLNGTIKGLVVALNAIAEKQSA
jgi:large subunit ribosomal protein L10